MGIFCKGRISKCRPSVRPDRSRYPFVPTSSSIFVSKWCAASLASPTTGLMTLSGVRCWSMGRLLGLALLWPLLFICRMRFSRRSSLASTVASPLAVGPVVTACCEGTTTGSEPSRSHVTLRATQLEQGCCLLHRSFLRLQSEHEIGS